MRSGIVVALLLAAARCATCQGIITTVAGEPFVSCGALGDGGPATSAQLCSPQSAAVDPSGNIYFYDYGNARIRKVTPSGTISTIAGGGTQNLSSTGEPALNAHLGIIRQLAVDPSGQRLCFADSSVPIIGCVFLNTGVVQGYGTGVSAYGGAGDGGNVADASFNDPEGVAFDAAGNLYISDFTDQRVRRVDAVTSVITTYAGPGPGYCCATNLGDGGPATSANLYEPEGLAYGNGGLYIADTGNCRVRRVDSATGIITTVAGDGSPYYSSSSEGGPAVLAGMNPSWIAVTGSGNLFIDVGTAVREVDTSGNITTIAGSPTTDGFGYDDIPATQTVFAGVSGLGWDALANRLLISDYPSRVRQIFYTPPTTTGLTLSPNPAYPGQQVMMTGTIAPTDATGTVRFHEGNLILGSAPVNNGAASFKWTPTSPGTYQLNAVYGGDPSHNLSSSSPINLNVQLLSTTTVLSSSLNPSTFGSAITLTAIVTPSTATGTVQFQNGGTVLGSVSIANGRAAFTTGTLPAGSDSLIAVYSGDARDASSTSAPLVQTVNKTSSTTTILASPASQSTLGQTVTFAAVVKPAAATGTVQFLDGTIVLGSATLSGGTAAFATSNLASGTHSIKARYSGDTNVSGSSSSTLIYKVKR